MLFHLLFERDVYKRQSQFCLIDALFSMISIKDANRMIPRLQETRNTFKKYKIEQNNLQNYISFTLRMDNKCLQHPRQKGQSEMDTYTITIDGGTTITRCILWNSSRQRIDEQTREVGVRNTAIDLSLIHI